MTLHNSMIKHIVENGINLDDVYLSKKHRYADLGYSTLESDQEPLTLNTPKWNHHKTKLKEWIVKHIAKEMNATNNILRPQTGNLTKALRSLPVDVAPTVHEIYAIENIRFQPDAWIINIDENKCPNICIFEVVDSHDIKEKLLADFSELQWALDDCHGSSYLFRICAKTGHVSLEQSMMINRGD